MINLRAQNWNHSLSLFRVGFTLRACLFIDAKWLKMRRSLCRASTRYRSAVRSCLATRPPSLLPYATRACVRACVRCGCAGESWSTSEQPANGRRAEKPAGSWRQNATRIYRLERSVGEVGEEVFKWYFFLKKSQGIKEKWSACQ